MHNTHITHRRQARQPVSVRGASGYDRPADVSVPPEKFFNTRVRLAIVCPETALMYAVLEDAFLCFQKQFETEQRFVQRAREAEDWFSAMTLAGSSPSCLSAMRSDLNRST